MPPIIDDVAEVITITVVFLPPAVLGYPSTFVVVS
jgi:hypothetical protein